MSTWQCYIMGKVQTYQVLTMEISEGLKELNPADQQLFLACYNLDVDKAAEAIRNGMNVNAAIEEDGISSITPLPVCEEDIIWEEYQQNKKEEE